MLSLMEYLMNIVPFPDLTQEAAAVRRRETLYEGSVDSEKATWRLKLRRMGKCMFLRMILYQF